MPGPLPSTRVQRQRARGGSRSRGLRNLLGRVPSASPCHVGSGPPPPPPSRRRRGGLPEAARRHCPQASPPFPHIRSSALSPPPLLPFPSPGLRAQHPLHRVLPTGEQRQDPRRRP